MTASPLAMQVAIGRRPYIHEAAGELLLQTDRKLRGLRLTVSAEFVALEKTWNWPAVAGGEDVWLPLHFDGLPARRDEGRTVIFPHPILVYMENPYRDRK